MARPPMGLLALFGVMIARVRVISAVHRPTVHTLSASCPWLPQAERRTLECRRTRRLRTASLAAQQLSQCDCSGPVPLVVPVRRCGAGRKESPLSPFGFPRRPGSLAVGLALVLLVALAGSGVV